MKSPAKVTQHQAESANPQAAVDSVGAINMTGDQLQEGLFRISALVFGGLKLISGIADDNVVHAEALLNMAADDLMDLQYQCVVKADLEGGAA